MRKIQPLPPRILGKVPTQQRSDIIRKLRNRPRHLDKGQQVVLGDDAVPGRQLRGATFALVVVGADIEGDELLEDLGRRGAAGALLVVVDGRDLVVGDVDAVGEVGDLVLVLEVLL